MDWQDGLMDFQQSYKSLKSQKLFRQNEIAADHGLDKKR
jgi:hypothetical protein